MKTQFWVVVEARRHYGSGTLRAMHAHTLRQSKPSLKPDEIAVRITLDIDPKAFTEPIYSVAVDVPAGMALPGPAIVIEVPPEEEVTE